VRANTTHGLGRRAAFAVVWLGIAALVSGAALWLWAQLTLLIAAHPPVAMSLAQARVATWRLVILGIGDPRHAFASVLRARLPTAGWWWAAGGLLVVTVASLAGAVWVRVRRWGAGSPLAAVGVRRVALDRGWVSPRTWARPSDLRRLWVRGPVCGRPYLGWVGRVRPRMLAAEVEVQPLVVAPPRAGKSSGFVIPWLLEHHGPALVLSTKRDVHDATVSRRRRLGRVWVYDPFGAEDCAGFTPLVAAGTWDGALRAGGALASAAHPDQANAASEFWDKEAAILIAPLLHSASLAGLGMDDVLRWLDTRNYEQAKQMLRAHGARAAWELLDGVAHRDERNRETTVMSATNLLRAYRYPQVARHAHADLTADRFLDGRANTVYVVASEADQQTLRPAILALVSAVYHAAIERARHSGALEPRLFMLLDEAANIAPLRDLASWLSQCGDHGVVIATVWQSIAQIDHRYGRPARDAILAAATAHVFLPPLADPTTTGYLAGLLGDELVAQHSRSSRGSGSGSVSVARRPVASGSWLREIPRGHALLVYRDLPPAAVRCPGWFEDPRFAAAAVPATRWPSPIGWGHRRT
jgi:type IV secretion system protein VirD4